MPVHPETCRRVSILAFLIITPHGKRPKEQAVSRSTDRGPSRQGDPPGMKGRTHRHGDDPCGSHTQGVQGSAPSAASLCVTAWLGVCGGMRDMFCILTVENTSKGGCERYANHTSITTGDRRGGGRECAWEGGLQGWGCPHLQELPPLPAWELCLSLWVVEAGGVGSGLWTPLGPRLQPLLEPCTGNARAPPKTPLLRYWGEGISCSDL